MISSSAEVTVEVTARTTIERPVQITLVVHVNEWAKGGVRSDTAGIDLDLKPGETKVHVAHLSVPERFPDDILSIQVFAVDHALNMHFLSQKVQARIRSDAPIGPDKTPVSVSL